MSAERTGKLVEHLWPSGDGVNKPQVYAVLDGARDPRVTGMVRASRLEHGCLYRGRLSPRLQQAAPWVVHLSRDARFTRELLDLSWGNAWGFFTRVSPGVSLEQHVRHFRRFLRVEDEGGRKLIFRFYDPRVLRIYLPTCTADEAARFFGPIPDMLSEGRDAERLHAFRPGPRGVTWETIEL